MLNAVQMSSEFVVYQVDKKQFKSIKSQNDAPLPRYDHSLISFEVSYFIFIFQVILFSASFTSLAEL